MNFDLQLFKAGGRSSFSRTRWQKMSFQALSATTVTENKWMGRPDALQVKTKELKGRRVQWYFDLGTVVDAYGRTAVVQWDDGTQAEYSIIQIRRWISQGNWYVEEPQDEEEYHGDGTTMLDFFTEGYQVTTIRGI